MTNEFILQRLETLLALSSLCPGDQDSSLELPGGSSPSCHWDPVVLPWMFYKPCLGLCLGRGPRLSARGRHTCFDCVKGNTKMSVNAAI